MNDLDKQRLRLDEARRKYYKATSRHIKVPPPFTGAMGRGLSRCALPSCLQTAHDHMPSVVEDPLMASQSGD